MWTQWSLKLVPDMGVAAIFVSNCVLSDLCGPLITWLKALTLLIHNFASWALRIACLHM